MSSALLSALKSAGVPPPSCWRSASPWPPPPEGGSTRRRSRPPPTGPSPSHPETRDFRFPAPDAYPLEFKPGIRSREDLIAYYTRGEDPAVVRRHVAGPEEELIDYLGEVFLRSGY